MRTSSSVIVSLVLLSACATGSRVDRHDRDAAWRASPSLTAPIAPAAAAAPTSTATPGSREDADAAQTALPVGIGFTLNPSTVLIGAAYDIPIDEQLTFGPAVQYGASDDDKLLTVTAQVKYFLPDAIEGEGGGQPKILPYIQAGVGMLRVDKKDRSTDSGAVVTAGAGIRYLTGQHYRIGSEAQLNFPVGDIADQDVFFSWEVLQVVFNF